MSGQEVLNFLQMVFKLEARSGIRVGTAMAGTANLEHGEFRSSLRDFGLFIVLFPALKRWATIGGPSGAECFFLLRSEPLRDGCFFLLRSAVLSGRVLFSASIGGPSGRVLFSSSICWLSGGVLLRTIVQLQDFDGTPMISYSEVALVCPDTMPLCFFTCSISSTTLALPS